MWTTEHGVTTAHLPRLLTAYKQVILYLDWFSNQYLSDCQCCNIWIYWYIAAAL